VKNVRDEFAFSSFSWMLVHTWSMMASSLRKWTSCLVGCTFTSTC